MVANWQSVNNLPAIISLDKCSKLILCMHIIIGDASLMQQMVHAKSVLTETGWQDDISIEVGPDGRIVALNTGSKKAEASSAIVLPALSNVHSHSFQRAMAGLAEIRGPNTHDDFWTWRKVMYRFLDILTPEDFECIAALVQMEMLEAGFSAVGEFHYVHHQPGGNHYDQIEELSLRHFEAAKLTGIGYTHLPVLYMQGGMDGRVLKGGQLRFGCSIDDFQNLHAALKNRMGDLPDDAVLGVAPHSLRAVSAEGLMAAVELSRHAPIHIHAAEQTGEIDDVVAALGVRPIRWLLDNMSVDDRWCLIHATHMDDGEVDGLAASGAVAGLCPMTEANLGDGVFRGHRYLQAGGAFGIGADSNIKIALSEELRSLETSQRLRDRRRVILTDEATPSNGRYLYERAARGGAQALGRASGVIKVGEFADLVSINANHPTVCGLHGDAVLDAWIFASDDRIVTDVWAAGRHVVKSGKHIHHEAILSKFTKRIRQLREAL
jgi:formimidoylglutamate deiminase